MPDQFHSDHPVTDISNDDLGRDAIAKTIATNVSRVWADQKAHSRPFAVHLSGRWGSGKSTILNFLEAHLRADTSQSIEHSGSTYPTEPQGWVVIKYNAWQMQNSGPAWWSLLRTVTTQGYGELQGRGQFLWLKDCLWRFGKVNKLSLILIAILSLLFIAALTFGTGEDITETLKTEVTSSATVGDSTAKITTTTVDPVRAPNKFLGVGTWGFIVAAIAALGTLGTITKVLQGFTKTSQETAEAVRTLQTDPTAHIKNRYQQVITDITRPTAAFIDDLDRCDAQFVVDLLQSLQTAYAEVPVLYVVASDRDWIVSAYNQVYKDFQPEVAKPGLPLGYLFVKKIFQLSVAVPDLAISDTETLTRALLELKNTDVTPRDIAEIEATFDSRIEAAVNDGDMDALSQIGSDAAETPAAKQVAAKLMEAVGSDEIQKKVRHALIAQVKYMDGNPRSLKRLINAITFRQGYILMAGEQIDFEIIARWTILCLRFPYTADVIADDPTLHDPKARGDDILKAMTQSDIAKIRRFG